MLQRQAFSFITCCCALFLLVRDSSATPLIADTPLIEETPSTAHQFHPDTGLNISQLLERHGYPFEEYTVQTSDGYLLGLHRVPYGVKNTTRDPNKPIAFMVHGMMSQSIDWLNNEPDNSLGLLLADKGYDVWLLNTRGNTYSRKHISLDPDVDKEAFWDFSWHELGLYDIPESIDFVLNFTGQDQLYYFGHSKGTTGFFVMGSMRPEYNQKIKLMTALAPTAFMNNSIDPTKVRLAKNLTGLKLLAKLLNLHELMGYSPAILKMVKTCCYEGSLCLTECKMYFNVSFGFSPTEFNLTMLPVHLSNSPSGFSAKDGFHFLQQFFNGARFRMYDFGVRENRVKYGQPEPPEYNLSNVVAPIALHYALEDESSSYKDVELLSGVLPNVVTTRLVPIQHFTHCDFIWGAHVNTLVYHAVFEDLDKF